MRFSSYYAHGDIIDVYGIHANIFNSTGRVGNSVLYTSIHQDSKVAVENHAQIEDIHILKCDNFFVRTISRHSCETDKNLTYLYRML